MSKIKRNIGYGHVCIRQKPRELCFDVIVTRLSILYFKALMSDAPSRALGVGGRLPSPGQGCTSSRANYRIHTRQQKALRANEDELCARYDISKLQLRRDVQLGSIMYRYSRNNKFVDNTLHRENLRSENKINFVCPFTKVTKIRKSPFYCGVDLWNSLRVEHHRDENKKRFKSLLIQTLQ